MCGLRLTGSLGVGEVGNQWDNEAEAGITIESVGCLVNCQINPPCVIAELSRILNS